MSDPMNALDRPEGTVREDRWTGWFMLFLRVMAGCLDAQGPLSLGARRRRRVERELRSRHDRVAGGDACISP